MPRNRPVSVDEIENMVAAANEMQGALMALIGNARSQGFQNDELDPLTLRQAASDMVTAARECSDIAVLMLSEAREIDRRRKLAAVVQMAKGDKS